MSDEARDPEIIIPGADPKAEPQTAGEIIQ